MRIMNLTNSPHDLVSVKGEKVRLPARGAVENFEPHPQHAGLYRSIGYFRIEADADAPVSNVVAQPRSNGDSLEALREQYRALTGKPADKRWSDARLLVEIEKLRI